MVSSYLNEAGMDVRGYDVKMSEHLWSYEFYSEGPKGKIKKQYNFVLSILKGAPALTFSWEIGMKMKTCLLI
jgi:hypothetical protein